MTIIGVSGSPAARTVPSFSTTPVIHGMCWKSPLSQISVGCRVMNAPGSSFSITGRYVVNGSTDQNFNSFELSTSSEALTLRNRSTNSVVVKLSIFGISTNSAWRFAKANGFFVGSLYGAVARPLMHIARLNRPETNLNQFSAQKQIADYSYLLTMDWSYAYEPMLLRLKPRKSLLNLDHHRMYQYFLWSISMPVFDLSDRNFPAMPHRRLPKILKLVLHAKCR